MYRKMAHPIGFEPMTSAFGEPSANVYHNKINNIGFHNYLVVVLNRFGYG